MRLPMKHALMRMGAPRPRLKKHVYRWRRRRTEPAGNVMGVQDEDSRLLNYLSASFKNPRRERRERQMEHSRLVVVVLSLVLLAYWGMHRIFL